MIEFVSLLLGLVSGYSAVEVGAAGSVAAIEVQLDGRTVAVRSESPWRFDCDFGDALEPHELVAIARDEKGNELDRTRRWVNLQSQAADSTMIFSGGEPGSPREASLVWESIGQLRPLSIEMTFDGVPLAVKDPERIPLPAYDPEQMHFVSAAVHFKDSAVVRLNASFGGGRSGEVASELTAVTVMVETGASMPPIEILGDWFLKDGEPVPVLGVEKGPAEVVVVRDPTVQPALETLLKRIDSWELDGARQQAARGWLGGRTRMRVLSPVGAPMAHGQVTPEMFAASATHESGNSGLLWLTQEIRPRRFSLLFPNAVALAGMHAHASTRRRAVVLLLGSSRTEQSTYQPSEVRRYLRLLQVPLFAWSLTSDLHSEWGIVRSVPLAIEKGARHQTLKEAVRQLRQTLDAQWIVWLEGRHLPQSIELAPQAVGIRFAGSV